MDDDCVRDRSMEGSMRDVRMKGFSERVDVEEVEAFLIEHTRVCDSEPVELSRCVGRVLSEQVSAEVDVPGFPRSAMDGYAIRGEESFGASAYNPIRFEIVGESMPGHPYSGELTKGAAVRIMTGAPVPNAA